MQYESIILINFSQNFFMIRIIITAAFTGFLCFSSIAQTAENNSFYPSLENKLNYRCIGPFRGGRSAAVTGVEGKPMLFYMGATGGGVWKTENGGSSWKNISDGYFGGSIGAVAVSKSNSSILYVGGGEVTVRGNVSPGTGMYKSVDGGRSWKGVGLENSRHIPRIRIHPQNPDVVYAAVLGDLFKDSEDRGVYKSINGGRSWSKILFTNRRAGAVDLILDPQNPEVIYASTWNVRRTPHDFSSGGEGSGLWKSNDGGSTWNLLSENDGMPEGDIGIVGVAVSPVNPNRVWAIIENENGGVFRSDNGGETWENINSDRSLRQRAWYYSRIYADPNDVNTLYVMNVSYHKSTDGGYSFTSKYAPHGDHHDLWIAPEDSDRMIIADDGGAQVSYDGGDSWSTYMNQPTAQFYRVSTDDHFPYRIYGAQQDNSTIRISSRSDYGMITQDDWESTAGGESAHLAPDPKDNEIVYGGSYGGFLTRYNHHTEMNRAINVWPDNPIGYGAEGMKYRFQWNFPVFFSPHDENKLYTCSQFLHVSNDGGGSWNIISPDLTKSDSSKLVSSGGPITKDNTGVEYYATIFSAVESPYEKDLLWCGSDDGLIHVSKNGGSTWENVTPKKIPNWALINSIEVDPYRKGGLYVAATLYKNGDYTPYLYRTDDYGKSWKLITKGIDESHFTRVIRADLTVDGLLYCGTEYGMYMSIDNGESWKPFQLNLPKVPITDIALKDNDMIVATQGRSFWVLDDLNVIWDLVNNKFQESEMYIHSVHPSVGFGGNGQTSDISGTNHPDGIRIYFNIPEAGFDEAEYTLKFIDEKDELIKCFSTKTEKKEDKLNIEEGLNHFNWNLRYPKADKFDGLLMWWGTLQGPKAPPGNYTVRLICNDDSTEATFQILQDPRMEGSVADRVAQFNFLLDIRNKLDETHDAIRNMRNIKKQIAALNSRLNKSDFEQVVNEGKRLDSLMNDIEKVLYQTKLKSNQDMLNYPIMLNNKLAHVASLATMGLYKPTAQIILVKEDISSKIDVELNKWKQIMEGDLLKYNALLREQKVNFVDLED